MKYLLIALIFVGCGDEMSGKIDNALLPIALEFQADAIAHGSSVKVTSINIGFDDQYGMDLGEGIIAGCKVEGIIVARKIWEMATDLERKVVMYHEFGHCLLGRDHKLGMNVERRIVLSMMAINIIAVISSFEANEEYYINELFEGK